MRKGHVLVACMLALLTASCETLADGGAMQHRIHQQDRAWADVQQGFAGISVTPSFSAWMVLTFFATYPAKDQWAFQMQRSNEGVLDPVWHVRMVSGPGDTEGVAVLPDDSLRVPPPGYYAYSHTSWASTTTCPGLKEAIAKLETMASPTILPPGPSDGARMGRADGTSYRVWSNNVGPYAIMTDKITYSVGEGPVVLFVRELRKAAEGCWREEVPPELAGILRRK